MILSTGPTGSGKSTSLYSILQLLNKPDVNAITLEDPVEYRIDGIRQVQLNVRAGMTFASGLRSILRQDPDVIMVGEIRDSETAQIAVQAALTGHLVLSTLHTNDAPGAVSRLMEMHIEPYLVASVLLCSFAQRLVRKVCPHCAEPYDPPRALLGLFGIKDAEGATFRRGKGCYHCGNTGYLGRIGIFEVMPVTPEIQRKYCPPGPRAGDFRHRPAAGRHEHSLRTRPARSRCYHQRRGSPPRRYGVGGPKRASGREPF
ncbi:MAG: GspE/PulE family protein [Bilophila wadsworthia]